MFSIILKQVNFITPRGVYNFIAPTPRPREPQPRPMQHKSM